MFWLNSHYTCTLLAWILHRWESYVQKSWWHTLAPPIKSQPHSANTRTSQVGLLPLPEGDYATLESITERLSSISTKLLDIGTQYKTAMKGANTRLEHMESSLPRIETNMHENMDLLGKTHNCMSRIESKMGRIEHRMPNGIEAHLDNIESCLGPFKSAVLQHKGKQVAWWQMRILYFYISYYSIPTPLRSSYW